MNTLRKHNIKNLAALTLAMIFVVCGIFDLGHILTSGISNKYKKQNATHSAFEKNHVPDEDTYHHSKTESVFKRATVKSIVSFYHTNNFSFHFIFHHSENNYSVHQTKIPFSDIRLYVRFNRLLI
jgi:hypothetical protein